MKTIESLVQEMRGFAQYPKVGNNLLHTLLGLGGEIGEVLDKVKKYEMRGLDLNNLPEQERQELCKELGDVGWYLVLALYELGFTLFECFDLNVAKLLSRQVRGKILGDGDNR